MAHYITVYSIAFACDAKAFDAPRKNERFSNRNAQEIVWRCTSERAKTMMICTQRWPKSQIQIYKLDEMLEIGLSVFLLTTLAYYYSRRFCTENRQRCAQAKHVLLKHSHWYKHSKNIICITSIPFDHVSSAFHFAFFPLTVKNPQRIVYRLHCDEHVAHAQTMQNIHK